MAALRRELSSTLHPYGRELPPFATLEYDRDRVDAALMHRERSSTSFSPSAAQPPGVVTSW